MIFNQRFHLIFGAGRALRSGTRVFPGTQCGFTFIELVMVIVMLGFLASIAIQKMLGMAATTEITVEDTTLSTLRSNLIANMGEGLLENGTKIFSPNPFANLLKVPKGYDHQRQTPPGGKKQDNDLWVYVAGKGGNTRELTPEETGSTLPDFQIDGFIYHQRKDNKIVRWAYDSSSGVISNRLPVDTGASSAD